MDASTSETSKRLVFLGSLVGHLAHELKNPLSTLNLNLQLLMEDLEHPASPKEARIQRKLALLRTETSRLECILDDFLRYARPHRLQVELASISAVIDEILDFMEPELRSHGIVVHKLYTHDVELYPLDRSCFKMALMNLLVNAQQAMADRGGEIIVRTDRHADQLVIHVIDTGPGIPEEIRARIFDVYFSTKRRGTGMGLAQARRVVEDHGGTLEVDSEVGKGSDFRITLPRPPAIRRAPAG
ncbi:MAG: two-component sensor histidine kinase [Planctomycetes bacterium]|nr:two-component sensor histidine kinase [Planctomycetota bacterium]